LAALLSHDSFRSPASQRIVESFVSRAHRLLVHEGHSRVVETFEIAHSVVSGRGHHPGIASIAQFVGESAVVLKKKNRLRRKCGTRGGPVDAIGQINIEIRDHRLALLPHVCGGGKIRLLNVLQLAD
jgi:hypothetical protein